ncbi:MAG: hypothetical protein CMJ48_11580 [Planctomycetaceae bacterium]|nr:hypothetical protein [Planctomycetaceae bacterium]
MNSRIAFSGRIGLAVGLALVWAVPAFAQTSYPMLMSLKPTAAQVGQTSEHTISSRYSMYGADRVLVSGAGVTGEIVHPEKKADTKPPSLTTMKVKFTVEPGALPGVREFRIATPAGVSTIGQLVIVRDKVIAEETKKNDTADVAQVVEVPSTVCGAIDRAEDVDYYRFKAAKGTAFSFHVRSMRLQDKIHDLQQHVDPIMTLRHSSGTTLASSDNVFYGDPALSYAFERDGEYLLEIRDVRFQGNKYWEYSIEVSNRPFLTNISPLGVAAGAETKFDLVGFNLPTGAKATASVPADRELGQGWFELPLGSERSNPVPIVVSDLPLVGEAAAENNTFETAQEVTLPAGINGRIEAENDIDCFRFSAKKGEKLTFEVFARRCQSGLDPYLRLLNDQGKQLSLNDDMRIGERNFADSFIENWTVPADGNYVIELRDLHLRGGDAFVYFIKVSRAKPYFELYLDTDKTQLTPGTNAMIFVRTVRKNGFAGEITLNIAGVPEGVSANCGRILAGKGRDACIVFATAADAKQSVSNIRITGTGRVGGTDEKPEMLSTGCAIYQEVYQPGGGRGHWPVSMHTVSVGAPSDILAVTLSTTDVVLKPGESKKIDVTIQRAEGFDKNVTLDVLYRHLSGVHGNSLPEGVTIDADNSKTLLSAKTSKGHITLKAAANAPPVDKQQVPIMANIAINFVMKATYTGPPVFVTVQKP